MQAKKVNDEVYVADQRIVQVGREDIETLKGMAAHTVRRRVRLCAHRGSQDALHEMLIVMNCATYVRPHRHRNKSESFHVMEGRLTVAVFNDEGRLAEVIRMGDYASGRKFFYRLAEPAYHTVVLESELAVLHETTNGPFDRKETEFAPWAPAEEDAEAARSYLAELGQRLTAWDKVCA